jgi:DNA-binding CsgD family transcriptional regulator
MLKARQALKQGNLNIRGAVRLRPNEIASMLLISPRTVERHVENIYSKLNVRSRKELLKRLLKSAPGVAQHGKLAGRA